ncbi:hypothetical protein OIU77_017429 [Salix suchowensis]|uniref:Uncharacterized protein n=1 Tax=Salix suchowensis TaxID=1278906 RepID=A0ABQ8ZPA4_9ROSI|nr:hypothetical protein OIU77_017429 [Salix suchowensis]
MAFLHFELSLFARLYKIGKRPEGGNHEQKTTLSFENRSSTHGFTHGGCYPYDPLKLSTLALASLILIPKSLFATQPLHFHSPPPPLRSRLCTVEEGTGRLKEGKDSTTHLETRGLGIRRKGEDHREYQFLLLHPR